MLHNAMPRPPTLLLPVIALFISVRIRSALGFVPVSSWRTQLIQERRTLLRVQATTLTEAKGNFLQILKRKEEREKVEEGDIDSTLKVLLRVGRSEGIDKPDTWKGRWVVCHAPHIVTLGKLLLTSFDVEYNFYTDGRMASFSEYQSPLFGRGWLNADGRVVEAKGDSNSVQVIFERFWWDIGKRERPTKAPMLEDGWILPWLVQNIGSLLFFEAVSVFPVAYLDEDLCVFEFAAAGTLVASQRVGPAS
ncbi:unnamed protein product [Discosporangium mesarthrocarpum]